MTYVVALILSMNLIVLGLFQIGCYVYFRYLHPTLPTLFSLLHGPLWCGIATILLASLTVCASWSGPSVKRQLEFRCLRRFFLLIFASVFLVQLINYVLSEIFTFRLWFDSKSALENEEGVACSFYAYVTTTSASVAALIIAFVACIYTIIILFKLINFLEENYDENSIGADRKTTSARKSNIRTPKSATADRLHASQTSISGSRRLRANVSNTWSFSYLRSSTPKTKYLHAVRPYLDTGTEKSGSSFWSIFGRKKRRPAIAISDDDLNNSMPLRLIATLNPRALPIGDESPPSPIINFYTDTTGEAGRNFFARNRNLLSVENDEKFVTAPSPLALNFSPSVSEEFNGKISKNLMPTMPKKVDLVVLPENAWRLPEMPSSMRRSRMEMSEEKKNAENIDDENCRL